MVSLRHCSESLNRWYYQGTGHDILIIGPGKSLLGTSIHSVLCLRESTHARHVALKSSKLADKYKYHQRSQCTNQDSSSLYACMILIPKWNYSTESLQLDSSLSLRHVLEAWHFWVCAFIVIRKIFRGEISRTGKYRSGQRYGNDRTSYGQDGNRWRHKWSNGMYRVRAGTKMSPVSERGIKSFWSFVCVYI